MRRVLFVVAFLAVLLVGGVLVSQVPLPFNAIEIRPGEIGDACDSAEFPGILYVVDTKELMRCNPSTDVWDKVEVQAVLYSPETVSAASDWVLAHATDTAAVASNDYFSIKVLPATDVYQVYSAFMNHDIDVGSVDKNVEFNSGLFTGFELFINGKFSAIPDTAGTEAGIYQGFASFQVPTAGGDAIEIIDGTGAAATIGKVTSDGTYMCHEWWDGTGTPAVDITLCRTAADNLTLASAYFLETVEAGKTAGSGGQGTGVCAARTCEYSTVAAGGDATLPAAIAGLHTTIINNGANPLEVFPASGDDAGNGVNTLVSVGARRGMLCFAYDATYHACYIDIAE